MGEGEPASSDVPLPPEEVKVEEKVDDSKAIVVVEKVPDPPEEKKISGGSVDRDVTLARLESQKKLSMIKAWEDNEVAKVENRSKKKLADVTSWEDTKKADIEAELKKMEGSYEKKKAEYTAKMKNRVASIHKEAEERRAIVEATRGEELLKAEEMAAKYRAKGFLPKKILGCFNG